jgi:hypothetical protein
MPANLSINTTPWPLLLAALAASLLFAAAIGLWVTLGTTVFFEMVRTGWMACF